MSLSVKAKLREALLQVRSKGLKFCHHQGGGTSDNPFKSIYAPYSPERPLESPTVTVSKVLAPSVPTQAPLGPASSVSDQFGFATGTGASFCQGPQVSPPSAGPKSFGQARESPLQEDRVVVLVQVHRIRLAEVVLVTVGAGLAMNYVSVDSSGSEEDVGVGRKLRKRRWKEQDSISTPQLPQGTPGFRSWRNTVLQSIDEAPGRADDQALVWAKQVEDPEVSDEVLEKVPDKFKNLEQESHYCFAKSCSRGSRTED